MESKAKSEGKILTEIPHSDAEWLRSRDYIFASMVDVIDKDKLNENGSVNTIFSDGHKVIQYAESVRDDLGYFGALEYESGRVNLSRLFDKFNISVVYFDETSVNLDGAPMPHVYCIPAGFRHESLEGFLINGVSTVNWLGSLHENTVKGISFSSYMICMVGMMEADTQGFVLNVEMASYQLVEYIDTFFYSFFFPREEFLFHADCNDYNIKKLQSIYPFNETTIRQALVFHTHSE